MKLIYPESIYLPVLFNLLQKHNKTNKKKGRQEVKVTDRTTPQLNYPVKFFALIAGATWRQTRILTRIGDTSAVWTGTNTHQTA